MSMSPFGSFQIRDLQQFHSQLDEIKGFDRDLLKNIALLTGELGELGRAVQDMRRPVDPGSTERAKLRVGEELAALFAYILKLVNYAGIDLEDAYRHKMEANLRRDWPKMDRFA